ncbi:hypothetical protein BT93_D1292 [Corymbia citriodora subsp. variegata]|nr:hypothetical protein BT93_D1292 [Corymbia citriodora subsp. variegata]
MSCKVYESAKSGDFDNLMTTILGNGEDLSTKQRQRETTFFTLRLNTSSCEVVRVFTNLVKSLYWVVENGQVDACKELLRKQNLHKDTALHYAVRGGHESVVKLLIEEDPQLCDITNATAESLLYLATDREHLNVMELILCASSLPSSHKGPKGLTALHAAINRPLIVWGKILEKRPEMIREGDDLGWTPLHYVAYMGNVKVVRLLLQQDTSVVYDLDKVGQSALLLAAHQGHLNVIDEIVKSYPDAWDLTSTRGQTALHAAVNGGQVNVVMYMLRMPNWEYLINEQDINGNTALHLAALYKRYKILGILTRDKRLDLLTSNKDHLTALDIFDSHKQVDVDAIVARRVLEGSEGMPHCQGILYRNDKEFEKQFVEGRQAVLKTTEAKAISFLEVQQIMAVLIATVTFTAVITMPGGFNDGPNKGRAILADSKTFQSFVIWNSMAFLFSIGALIILNIGRFYSNFLPIAVGSGAAFIGIVLYAMMAAFLCGVIAVLNTGIETSVIRLFVLEISVLFLVWQFSLCFVSSSSFTSADVDRLTHAGKIAVLKMMESSEDQQVETFWVCEGSFISVFTVDCNYINFYEFPRTFFNGGRCLKKFVMDTRQVKLPEGIEVKSYDVPGNIVDVRWRCLRRKVEDKMV